MFDILLVHPTLSHKFLLTVKVELQHPLIMKNESELILVSTLFATETLLGDTVQKSNQLLWNCRLGFEDRGNLSTQRKTCQSRVENQQTQPTCDSESRNRTRATLVGG